MPKVSVIIPTYNMAKFVSSAVNSVLSQTYKYFEVIIVNDGSTDRTREVLKRYKKHRKIKIINQSNKGLACSRNTGIKLSKGKYIAWLDADDIWRRDFLEIAVALLESHKEISFVHANLYRFKENVNDAKSRILLFDVSKVSETTLIKKILLGSYHVNNTQVIKKECIQDIGMFDERLSKRGCEDLDLWLRMLRKYKSVYINKPLIYYRQNLEGMSKNLLKMKEANHYVLDKFFSDPMLPEKIVKIKRAAYANMYFDYGYGNFCQKKHFQAFINTLQALIHNPFVFERRLRQFFSSGSYQ